MPEPEVSLELPPQWASTLAEELRIAEQPFQRTVVRGFDGEDPLSRITIQVAGRAIWSAFEALYALFRNKSAEPAPPPPPSPAAPGNSATLKATHGPMTIELKGASWEEVKAVINALNPPKQA